MRYHLISDKGVIRKQNQDNCGLWIHSSGAILAVVCDGIAGSNSGEVASECAKESLRASFEKAIFSVGENYFQWLRKAINKANRDIIVKSSKSSDYYGMGTTLVGALITKNKTYVFNVGDSRCYLLTDHLSCVTKDHTLVESMIDCGLITEKEALNSPQRHVLINALGMNQTLKIDIEAIQQEYSGLLLCSDGLHGYVNMDMAEKVLQDSSLSVQQQTETLVAMANAAGGYDNVTVVLIRKEEGE